MSQTRFMHRAMKCKPLDSLRQETLIALLGEGTSVQAYFKSLDKTKWKITSFNPYTREVCVELTAKSGKRHIHVVLPYIQAF